MLSIDTNLLFFAYAKDRPEHSKAWAWMMEAQQREDVAISEFILVEFYRLLRNPTVMEHPLEASEAVEVLSRYRRHPRWKLVGFTSCSQGLHDELFRIMARDGIAYRRIYDTRTALALRRHGVTESRISPPPMSGTSRGSILRAFGIQSERRNSGSFESVVS